ncbi:MAG: dihydrolipoamide acetyltransferase family protein [Tenuifilaceae bacterium]|jgi:2-oxoglutarate dehydrogenase E2 component (dihydrolipoamide succinyltransferase)|uniref:dihydrolipoamide acetyltransferase family protein n=1 Tax=Perlabentimonas gracilis TaxID=2715279 RepID=UPI00140B9509|nr:dihydrolipoamide acetyltransferase family protein [Perlabentimonas gracilis]MDX9771078.1 dihydrolipoamide acetyltransferase family protein [Tenuifilaceae bacterium]NHB69657.1 2-oxo acid dehydrogenase subunit E2 [Perlabentimonas gracilis]
MFEIKMPKLGESVEQATITKWFIKVGDTVEEDDNLLEIATDKVDSEIPSPVEGKVHKILFKENDLVPVGEVIAIINTGDEVSEETESDSQSAEEPEAKEHEKTVSNDSDININSSSTRFYSPLVKSIAKQENISQQELDSIEGTGKDGRVRKDDLLGFISRRGDKKTSSAHQVTNEPKSAPKEQKVNVSVSAGDEIIEMDRMRKLIAEHMVMSKQVSPHVTNMVEADVTALVKWREMMKETYQKKYKTKLTFMPLFTEAAARALRDFPMVNSSVNGDKIIVKGSVNIGIAVAKPDGNLIVPVIREADKLNIPGLASAINNLAEAARTNKLSPDDIQNGTFSITNFGTFRNVMGTPIISQPQVAILATGTIEKKPAVVETEHGDIIVPRHKMFLSLSYDHRIIDGALGGAFLRRVADYLEQFDANREV